MKRTDLQNLHKQSLVELAKLITEKRIALSKFRLEKDIKREKNVHRGQLLRWEIARLETIFRQKQTGERKDK